MSWMTRLFAKARVPMAMLVALTVCGAGCQSDEKDEPTARAGETFVGDDERSAVTRIIERQVAAGAAEEATLRPYHFDHARLNSLGRQKLDLMLADGAADSAEGDELVVYVDIAADGAHAKHADARRASVADYLTVHAGLAERQFRVESGPNPYNTMSAANAAPRDDADASAAEGDAAAGGDAGGFGQLSEMMPAK